MTNLPRPWRGAALRVAQAVTAALMLSCTAAVCLAGPAWVNYEPGLSRAAKERRFVLVDFHTTWCKECKKMDTTTFSDPDIVKRLKDRFVTVLVDGDSRTDLVSQYGVFAYPTLVVLEPGGGKVCQNMGYMSPDDLRVLIDYTLTGAYKKMGLRDYIKSRRN